GGKESIEFMVASDVGEDLVAHCESCGYAANVETATSRLEPVEDPDDDLPVERFATPGVRTILDLETFEGGAPAERQIKTLVYLLDGEPALVLLRGDHVLQDQKLLDGTGAIEARPAHAEEIAELMGADAGSLGAVGVDGMRIIADPALQGRRGMTTGANENDVHVRGVDVDRDIAVSQWLDLRTVINGEACPNCGARLDVFPAIEVGHIFKLGTFYAEPLGVKVLDRDGTSVPVVMGSYGIGVERNMAASVEANHDDNGIVWPLEIAPFAVVITVVRPDDGSTAEVAERLYGELRAAGIETLLDDRDERPGVKFTDAELIGIPYRITVGPRGVEQGVVELVPRAGGDTVEVPIDDVTERMLSILDG
ncbi:MAG: His/Gly/Thr/Pro-type tRNA ligase C-terminal domain-containing protein, partial [Acidimicrobiia bacterium]|nr:His/Gly/Thr/Pro-type tRNA ligase C-terminal domain-containing protein [Acidimicrobiia bacterium]